MAGNGESHIDWPDRMRKMRSEQLAFIALSGSEGDFVEEAVNAAQQELDRRDPSGEERKALQATAKQWQECDDNKNDWPLSNGAWVCFIIFGPLLMFTVTAVILLGVQGYTRKAKEAGVAILLSYGFYTVLILAFLALIFILER